MPIDLNDSGLEAAFTLENEKTGVIDQPPFHVLVLGNWSGDGERKALSERRTHEIDRDNFDEMIGRLGSRLSLDFEDGSSVMLEFSSLDDLHPDEIFKRVPLFSQFRDLRKRLRNADTFNAAARDVRALFGVAEEAKAEAAREQPEEVSEDLLDAILTKPSGGALPPKPGVSSEIGRLVSDLVRPHLVSVNEDEQASLVAAVDTATGALMAKILRHPKFKAFEAAWRGLFFFVRRTDTSAGLKIFLLDCSRQEMIDDLRSAENLTATSLFKKIVRDSVETPGADPWSLICGDYAFSPEVEDVAALMRMSKIAASAGAPFVSHIRPDVFGVHSIADQPEPSRWKISGESNAAKLWFALRGQPESQYLGMAMPRFLVRLPYGADTDPIEAFDFEEFAVLPQHDDYLWANGCFLVATLLAKSYAEFEWEMGRQMFQDIDGLPVHVLKVDGETTYKPCAEIQMTDEGVDRLMNFGFMPLISYRSTDRVKVGRFQSIADPVTGLKGRWS